MNAVQETTEQIVRRLAALLSKTDEPLEIRVRDHNGRIYWTAKPCSEAAPYLVGKGGGHVKAIQHLFTGFGRACGGDYSFRLLDPDPGPLRAVTAPPAAPDYDPTDLAELLEDVLDALGVGEYMVKTEPRGLSSLGAPQYELEVWVRDDADYQLLTVEPDDGTELNNISAIGVLWRAAASISGGRVSVTVRRA